MLPFEVKLTEPDMTQNVIIERIMKRNIDAKKMVILRLVGSILSPAHEKLNSSQKGSGE